MPEHPADIFWHGAAPGCSPLGALLLTYPLVGRDPLRFNPLCNTHPLYRCAVKLLEEPPLRLWARRSPFDLHDAPLPVTDGFLHGILLLAK